MKLADFFSCSSRVSFHAPKTSVRKKIMRYKQEGLVCQSNRLLILLDRAETEIRFSMANVMFKNKMDIDRHGPRRMPNNYQHLDPLYFSLYQLPLISVV